MIKLIGNESLTVNKQVVAGEEIVVQAIVRNNYPDGSNLGTMVVTDDFNGVLDSQEIALQEGDITISYSGSNLLIQNLNVTINGGDNVVIIAEKLFEFDSGGKGLLKSKVIKSGNQIKIIFVEGEERSITSEADNGYLVITFTYIENDTFIDFLGILSENDYVETDSLIEAVAGGQLEHDTLNGTYPAAIRIDDTHFLLAYTGDGSDGYFKTFVVTNYIPAEIANSKIEHDTTEGTNSQLEQIDSNHFLLAYLKQYSAICVKVIAIDGSFIPSVIATYSAPGDTTFAGNHLSMAKLDSSHFYLAYSASPTASIAYIYVNPSTYSISRPQTYVHEATNIGYYNSLKRLDATHLILAYGNSGSVYGTLKVFNVTPTISVVAGSEVQHANYSRANCLEIIDSNHCLLAYNNNYTSPMNIHLKTFFIGGDYIPVEIAGSFLDLQLGYYPVLKKISLSCYMIAANVSSYGKIFLIGIDGDYIPSVLPDNTIILNTSITELPVIEKITDYNYIIAHGGTGNDGYLFSIYVDFLKGKALNDLSEDNMLEGGFTPELEITELKFQGETVIGGGSTIITKTIYSGEKLPDTIRKLSLFDIARGKTVPTVTTDKEITFYNMIYSTVKSKEDIGIVDKNLVKQVSEFPADPEFGQIAVMAGKSYIYRES